MDAVDRVIGLVVPMYTTTKSETQHEDEKWPSLYGTPTKYNPLFYAL